MTPIKSLLALPGSVWAAGDIQFAFLVQDILDSNPKDRVLGI